MKEITVLILFLIHSRLVFAAGPYGVFLIVKGQVLVINNTDANIQVKIGSKIYPKQTIVTGKDSMAKIVMSDRNVIHILPESTLRIDQYVSELKEKNVRLSLLNGKIRTNIEQKYDNIENIFEIKTPSAVAGVRGTQFVTSYRQETNTTAVTTFRGEVMFRGVDAFSNKRTEAVFVKKGETSENKNGHQPGTPIKIQNVLLQQLDKETAVYKSTEHENKKLEVTFKNNINALLNLSQRNDNLLGDTSKNIIVKPARVNIIIKQ